MNNRNFSKAVEAVSPVVATLLLVLVAAGAAIGFGVFLNGFQKNAQSKTSSDTPQETLTIGGSSTVFELTEKALPQFRTAHPSIKIIDQEGGSTSGIQAACRGTVDIGAASKAVPATSPTGGQDLATCPQDATGAKIVGKDLNVITVGYDGVAMSYVKDASTCTGGVINLTPAAIKQLYAENGHSGAGADATDTSILATAPAAGYQYTWTDLAGIAGGSATGCSTNVVALGERSDSSGTEDGFCSKLLVQNDGTHCDKTSHQLLDGSTQYFNHLNALQGNDGIATWLAGTSATSARLSFIGSGTTVGGITLTQSTINGVAPGATAIRNSGALATAPDCTLSASWDSTHYCAARPLNYITAGAPTAVEQLFLDFMLNTLNNQNLNAAAGYVSIYG
jgi:phosphate transport system substrate-binding protein